MYDIMINFKKYLIKSLPDMVIKYNNIAKNNETIDTRRAADIYIAASLGIDTFYTYPKYSKKVLINAGFTEEEIKLYSIDRTKIPLDRRTNAMLSARKEVLETYVESNNYYRMLNGQPDLDDVEEIWLPQDIYLKYELEPKPLLELDSGVITFLEANGEFDYLYKKYPNKQYLYYIGKRKIDIVKARMADNYELLYIPKFDDALSFYRDFCSVYEECREYFMNVIYNQQYASRYEYFDNYLAFMILTMTINNMVSGVFKSIVTRDFYDSDTLRVFLTAYGIEYDGRFNAYQLRLIAKNLNVLLQKKGTDQVLLDIMDILGYNNFKLMKYYLVKQHKLDDKGKPYFAYKKEIDTSTGEEKTVLDYDKMFSFYFARAEVGTYDPQSSLHDTDKIFRYDEITMTDKYWIEDKQLREHLLNTTFNCIDTKYMDINVVYRMHKIVFETTYVCRMILDKPETKQILVGLPKLTVTSISLFDTITVLICLLCRYYKIKPTLLKSPSKILHVMGYNFKADFESIKKDMAANPDIYDKSLIKYVKTMLFTSVSDVNNMYVNIKDLDNALVSAMNQTYDHKAYNALRKLYETLMWTELTNETYTMEDGTIPDYFTDYLAESNPEVAALIDNMTDDECTDMVDYITSKLSNMLYDTKYLNYIKILDLYTIEAILKLLRFFKSYTVDLRDVNVVLIFDSRYYNMIHFSHDMMGSGNVYIPDSSFVDKMLDTVKKFMVAGTDSDNIINADDMLLMVYLFRSSFIGSHDLIRSVYTKGYDSLLLHMKKIMYIIEVFRSNGLISSDELIQLTEHIDWIIHLYNDEEVYIPHNMKFHNRMKNSMIACTKNYLHMKNYVNWDELINVLLQMKFEVWNYASNHIESDEITNLSAIFQPNDNNDVSIDHIESIYNLFNVCDNSELSKVVKTLQDFFSSERINYTIERLSNSSKKLLTLDATSSEETGYLSLSKLYKDSNKDYHDIMITTNSITNIYCINSLTKVKHFGTVNFEEFANAKESTKSIDFFDTGHDSVATTWDKLCTPEEYLVVPDNGISSNKLYQNIHIEIPTVIDAYDNMHPVICFNNVESLVSKDKCKFIWEK